MYKMSTWRVNHDKHNLENTINEQYFGNFSVYTWVSYNTWVNGIFECIPTSVYELQIL